MVSDVAALTLAVLAATSIVARPAAATLSVEDIVARHLSWLKSVDNYQVEIRVKGRAQPPLTAFVDNTKSPPEINFQGTIDVGGSPHVLVAAGTQTTAHATLDATRGADLITGKNVAGLSLDAFSRDATIDQAMRRLQAMATDITPLDNAAESRIGIRIRFAPDYLASLEAAIDQITGGAALPRNVDVALWFNYQGRPERTILHENTPDMLVLAFKYVQVNVPVAGQGALKVPPPAGVKSYPTFAEMLRDAAREGH